MPDPPPAPWPIDPRVREQLRRVRWRRRVREAQRVGFVLAGGTGLVAAGLVPTALRGSTVAFTAAAIAAAFALGALAVAVGRGAWRRRVPRGHLALWIDGRTGLRGALATLVELRRPGALLPLLAERNTALLEAWRPERLVPDVVPPGPLALLGAGVAALALAVRLAPRLLPAAPEVVLSEVPLVAVDARALPRRPDRLVVGPDGGGVNGAGVPDDGRPTRAVAEGGGPRGLPMTWTRAMQERLRQQLWGRDWDRLREALARAEAAARAGESTRPQATRRTRPAGDDAPDAETAKGATASRLAARERGREAGRVPDEAETAADGGRTGATGAGTGTDPDLLGAPARDVHAGADPFALAMAARVRSRRGGTRPPTGDPPPGGADEPSALARTPWREDPVHRMTVPPAWEPVVRAVFAHREAAP